MNETNLNEPINSVIHNYNIRKQGEPESNPIQYILEQNK